MAACYPRLFPMERRCESMSYIVVRRHRKPDDALETMFNRSQEVPISLLYYFTSEREMSEDEKLRILGILQPHLHRVNYFQIFTPGLPQQLRGPLFSYNFPLMEMYGVKRHGCPGSRIEDRNTTRCRPTNNWMSWERQTLRGLAVGNRSFNSIGGCVPAYSRETCRDRPDSGSHDGSVAPHSRAITVIGIHRFVSPFCYNRTAFLPEDIATPS